MPKKQSQSRPFASGVAFMFSIIFFFMGVWGVIVGSDALGGMYMSAAYGAHLSSSCTSVKTLRGSRPQEG